MQNKNGLRALRANRRLLLIDDEPSILRAIARILTHAGYVIPPVTTGNLPMAAGLLRSRFPDSGDSFDAVVTDLEVKANDGRCIVGIADTHSIPCIVLSGIPILNRNVPAGPLIRHIEKPNLTTIVDVLDDLLAVPSDEAMADAFEHTENAHG